MFSGTGPDGLPCPVGHTRIPVAQCNSIYIFPGVGLAVTAVRPTRLTGAMMTAAAAVSGAATIRRDPHGTLLPGRAQLTDTATVVASVVTKAEVANAVAPALIDDQIDRPFGRTRWLPRDHRLIAARGAGCALARAGCGGAAVPGGAGGPGGEGVPVTEVARGHQVARQTVYEWLARYAAGYLDQCWTLARVADQVQWRFGVEYTLAGMDVLLHRIGWSVQVPARRAAERDEDKIARWREDTWPVIKGPRRTWAPGSASRTSQARA